MIHSAENVSHAPNRMRSATAPAMSATVTIAKPASKATNSIAGMCWTSGILPVSEPSGANPPNRCCNPANAVGSPIRPALSGPNAAE